MLIALARDSFDLRSYFDQLERRIQRAELAAGAGNAKGGGAARAGSGGGTSGDRLEQLFERLITRLEGGSRSHSRSRAHHV